jgi:hypothetical protein
MSKTAISQYSGTPSSNSDVDGIDISEGCPASNLNNAQRSLMSHLKEMDDGTSALTSPSMGQLNVDNLRLDGNTISSTDTNGDITIDPNGTGDTIIASGNLGIGDATPIALLTMVAADGVMADQYVAKFTNSEATTGQNYGVFVAGGSSSADESFGVRNFDSSKTYLKVRGDGNVGIGTASPQQLLHLKSNNPGGKIRLEMGQTGVANGDVTGEIQFYHNDSSGAGVNADIKGICTNSAGAGALTFGTGTTSATERMRIDSSGNLRIGTTAAQITSERVSIAGGLGISKTDGYPLGLIRGNTYGQIVTFFNYGGNLVGSINVAASSTSYNTSSDYRLKENVTYDWDATTRLKQLKPARFNFIIDPDKTVDGFLAHEVTAVPEAISGTKDEVEVWKDGEELPDGVSAGDNKLDADGNTIPVMQGIDQSKLVPLLVKTIQELEARITALEAE